MHVLLLWGSGSFRRAFPSSSSERTPIEPRALSDVHCRVMEAGSSVHGEADGECDRVSLSSLATTASLSSRIASLAIFGEDRNATAARNYDLAIETLGEGDEEEELVEVCCAWKQRPWAARTPAVH